MKAKCNDLHVICANITLIAMKIRTQNTALPFSPVAFWVWTTKYCLKYWLIRLEHVLTSIVDADRTGKGRNSYYNTRGLFNIIHYSNINQSPWAQIEFTALNLATLQLPKVKSGRGLPSLENYMLVIQARTLSSLVRDGVSAVKTLFPNKFHRETPPTVKDNFLIKNAL